MPAVDVQELPIWRYLSAAALIKIIESSTIKLTNTRYFADELDGTGPVVSIAQGEPKPTTSDENDRKYVSCWSRNNPNDMTMWTSYADCSSYVAIQSTIGGLRDAFEKEAKNILIKPVNYWTKDQETSYRPPGQLVFLKRHAFKFEQEVRVAHIYEGAINLDENDGPDRTCPVQFDASAIDHIYLHPFIQPKYEKKLTEALKQLQFDKVPEHTDIYYKPITGYQSLDQKSRLRHCTGICFKKGY